MHVTVDFRERSSGLIDVLTERGATVELLSLRYGDYVIDSRVTVERKTAPDFLVSIIDGRLFRQAAALKRYTDRPLLIIEGDPFRTEMNFDRSAIMGALVSIGAVWQLPVLHTESMEETISCFRAISRQQRRHIDVLQRRSGYRPVRLITRQLHLLQVLPLIGPEKAKRLLLHFGSIAAVMAAGVDELAAVDGIGQTTADRIRTLLDARTTPFTNQKDFHHSHPRQ